MIEKVEGSSCAAFVEIVSFSYRDWSSFLIAGRWAPVRALWVIRCLLFFQVMSSSPWALEIFHPGEISGVYRLNFAGECLKGCLRQIGFLSRDCHAPSIDKCCFSGVWDRIHGRQWWYFWMVLSLCVVGIAVLVWRCFLDIRMSISFPVLQGRCRGGTDE